MRSNKPTSLSSATPTINGTGKNYRVKLTEKERERVQALIRNAKSLAEVQRLEKDLNEGRIPGGAGDAMDET